MKTYTKKNLITKLVISVAVSIIAIIVMYATGLWNFEGESMLYAIIMIFASLIFMPFGVYSCFFIRWGKALSGILFPIPVVSYMLECFKGLIPAALSIVALIKGKETFTYGKSDDE